MTIVTSQGSGMSWHHILIIGSMVIRLASFIAGVVVIVLLIRALLKYLRSDTPRKEDAATRRSLGETLRNHRTRCQMTQEFVASSLGVSRQAVSKWENGTADPSTSNLLRLAKLYGVSAEELLRGVE